MSKHHPTDITTYDDGGFVRTAIVVPAAEGASFDLVDEHGNRLALVNAFVYPDKGDLSVDIIDKDKSYPKKEALVFEDGQRQSLDTTWLVCAWFTGREHGSV